MKLWLVIGLYDRLDIEVQSSHPTRRGAEIARREHLMNGFRELYSPDEARDAFSGLHPVLLHDLVDSMSSGAVPGAEVTGILEQVGYDRSHQYQLSTVSVDVTVEELMELLAVAKAEEGA
ncbi:hypothetical protein HN766_20225 [Candidatus Poribacteria bacterium]|nr:hypothetical protein [Candidatus Poribacteria bacterium]